jgi:uncharacterized membrane protein
MAESARPDRATDQPVRLAVFRIMQMQTPPTRSVTMSVTIDRPAAEVHTFLADAANWPRWAIINILAVEPGDESGWWTLTTPDGPAQFRIYADAATGIVDHDFRDESMEAARVPARVVGNGRGADFLMTITQPPGVSDAFFEDLLRSVETELATLKKLLESPES